MNKIKSGLSEAIVKCNEEVIRYWLKGLYVAEGDKTGKRLRIWNQDKELLIMARNALKCLGIEVLGPYIDDKRHSIYVIEIPARLRNEFLIKICPEHPKFRSLTHL